MPYKPKRMCTTPGCLNFAVEGGACAECTAKRERARGNAASRGYGARWRQLRAAFLSANPFCAHCGAPATDVDHIIPRSLGGTDVWGNLQALCHACHSAKTGAQTPR